MTNSLVLLAEATVYFSVMALLFRLRARVGVGVFLCALGVMHFLETYLASAFYVATPFGIVTPGSAVLFSGKLVMLLLLYIKEDAATVRQPIYGLLLGNLLMVFLVLLLRLHEVAPLASGAVPDISFVDEMGGLMVWGTTLLYVDSILIILLYEKLGRSLRSATFLRISVVTAIILTFDQAGFYAGLRLISGAPFEVFLGGWYAKMAAAVAFGAMAAAYLRWFEPSRKAETPRGIADVFQTLTYRERYEALVEHAGRDSLTGLMHRGRFEELGEQIIGASRTTGSDVTLLVIDVDHFKSINDRYGHGEGDRMLKALASLLLEHAGQRGHAFRIGGEEFAVLCPYPHAVGRLMGEAIRQAVNLAHHENVGRLSVSVGVATVRDAASTLSSLFALADERLYAAKAAGRNKVVGEDSQGDIAARPLARNG